MEGQIIPRGKRSAWIPGDKSHQRWTRALENSGLSSPELVPAASSPLRLAGALGACAREACRDTLALWRVTPAVVAVRTVLSPDTLLG